MKPERLSEAAKTEFSQRVELKAISEGKSYIDALLEVVIECNIPEESAAKLVNRSLKDRLEAEAIDSRMIRGTIKGANVFDV